MKKFTAYVLLMMLTVVMLAGTVWANDANARYYRYYDYNEWHQWYMNWMNRYYQQYRIQPQPVPEARTLAPEPKAEPTPAPTPTVETTPITERTDNSQLNAREQAMIDKVNQERSQRGLQSLEVDMRLVKLAREKANDMIVNNYFDHQSPTLGSPFDQMKRAGVKYRYAGENLAGSPTVDRAHTGLMNSPGHRANILKDRYTHIGVGVIDGGPYGTMWVQMFIEIY